MDYEKNIFKKLKEDLIVQEEKDATALLQSDGNLGYINEVGSFLWRHCEGKNINQLYSLLSGECKDLNLYSVADVKNDIAEFMNELYKCGYVIIEEVQ